MDFLARRVGNAEGFNSRMGVGPIETFYKYGTQKGLEQMLATTAVHFDGGFGRNGFAWVTNTWEVCLLEQFRRDRGSTGMDCLRRWLQEIRGRWPLAACVTLAEFGLTWRRQAKLKSQYWKLTCPNLSPEMSW